MHSGIIVLSGILSLALVVGSLIILFTKDLLVAVLGSAVISLIVSIFFLILQAPDVAITEASIGAGLTTGIFLYAIKKAGRYEE